MKRFTFLIGVAAAALATSTPVFAQEVVMRRPLLVPTKGADWQVSPFVIYDASGNVVQPEAACGPYDQRRDVDCVKDGRVVGDSYCREAGPKPDSSKSEFLDAGCSYAWFEGGWQDPGPSCSNAEAQEQTVECRRVFDDAKVADSYCSGAKPDTDRTVVDHSTCTYSWNDSAPFVDPGPACTASETWEKRVFCERDLDKDEVAASFCTDPKPATTEVKADYSTCSYSWDSEATFTDPGNSCTATETQTRAVWCRRDLDQNVEDDARCNPAQRPASSQQVEDYKGCSYSAVNPGQWNYASTCSASTTRTRTLQCRRSDGTIVDDKECTDRDISLTETETGVQNLSSCQYEAANWTGPANPTCSDASTKTEEADCRRSDGTIVPDAQCISRDISLTRTVATPADYSSCTYSAVNWTDWSYASACSDSTTRTMTADCRRSNGKIVPGAVCNDNGVAVTRTETGVSNTTGCSYEWKEGGFTGAWSSTCSNSATRTQSVWCQRSDGKTVTSGCNPATRPNDTEGPMGIYSSCGYTANYGAWSACNGTSRSRDMTSCTRSTGDNVALSYCTDRGSQLTQTESCLTYAWADGGWGSWSSTCSANATRSKNYYCRASNGQTVADGNCAGPKPTQSESGEIYSNCTYTTIDHSVGACDGSQRPHYYQCRRDQTGQLVDTNTYCGVSNPTMESCVTYAWTPGAWSAWSSTCSANATRTQDYYCRASNGQTVADGNCAGPKPTNSESSEIYSNCTYTRIDAGQGSCDGLNKPQYYQCRRDQTGQMVDTNTYCGVSNPTMVSCATYEWRQDGFVNPSPSCTASETQYQRVWCRRSDGAEVSESLCGGGKPATSRNVEDYSGCTNENFSVSWGGFSSWSSGCTTSATRTQTGSCLRNGVAVASSECTSRGISLTYTETSPQYSSCTYTPGYGSFSACSGGSQSAPMTSCTRNVPEGNQSVDTSWCINAGHPNPKTQTCTMPPPTQTTGEFCSGGSSIFAVQEERNSGTTEAWATNSCRAQGGNCLAVDRYVEVQSNRVVGSFHCSRNATPAGQPYDSRNDDPYAEDYQQRYSRAL